MLKGRFEQHQSAEHSSQPVQPPAEETPQNTLPPLRNRAGESDSPYVRRHADTPVAWQLLDEATIERAKEENKPIFMHIGFLADHFCHLTTQDSFSNPAVAEFLNQSFIPILIDREERPDLDTIFQNYSEAVNATGGWPLNLFLTPDLYPIFGGTYWPGPGTEHSTLGSDRASESAIAGEPGEDSYGDFLAIAKKIHGFWVTQEERCRREAFEMLHKLQDFAQEGTFSTPVGSGSAASAAADNSDLDLDQLDEALTRIAKMFDPVYHGFGTPKFPNPARLSFLLRLAKFPTEVSDVIGEREVENGTAMALKTLRRIRDGGLHDHLGAGFMRFSVTKNWGLPHFEKMVCENALLLGVFLDAWLGYTAGPKGPSLQDEFADVVVEVADYLTGPIIRTPQGGFVTSEAADSYYRRGDKHMREGAYYLWTRREFDQVVGGSGTSSDDHALAVAAAYWNVLEDGNVPQENDPFDEFINQNVLCVNRDVVELSRQFGMPQAEIRRVVDDARAKLRAHREKERVRPERDEKVVVSTNGMVISALARTAAALKGVDDERAARYLKAAEQAASFIKEKLWDEKQTAGNPLRRFWYQRPSDTKAFADDYAFLIEGLLDLYTTTLDKKWADWAKQLQDAQIRLFYDPIVPATTGAQPSPRQAYSGGFYSNELAAISPTILRLKSGMDKSQPSTNAVAAANLFRLGALFASKEYTSLARETVNAFEAEVLQYPWLFVGLLASVVSMRLGVRVVKVKGKEDEAKLRRVWRAPRAEACVVVVQGVDGEELAGKVEGLRIE